MAGRREGEMERRRGPGRDEVPPRERRAGGTRIGRIDGITIRVHWTFLLLVALVVVGNAPAGVGTVVRGVVWIVALFASVVAHELAHSIVARRRGADVQGILLLPIGGLSQLDEMPEDPRDEAAIAAAGPAASIAAGFGFLAVGLVMSSQVWPPTLLAGSWLARLGWLNLVLGAFNLLPALPMDGGRLLRAVLARHRDRAEATHLAGGVARALAAVMIVVGIGYDLWLVLIGVFVWVAASAEEEASRRPHRDPGDGSRPGPGRHLPGGPRHRVP